MTTSGIRFDNAFLADYATVTNGLVQVVNGGVNTIGAGGFPASLPVYLVIFATIQTGYDGEGAPTSVVVRAAAGEDVYARMEGVAYAGGGPFPEGDVPAMSPVVLNLTGVVVPRAGRLLIDISLAGDSRTLEVQVMPPAELLTPIEEE